MNIIEIYRENFARLTRTDYESMSELQLAKRIHTLYDLCENGNQYIEDEDGEESYIWHSFQCKAYWHWAQFGGGWYHPTEVPTVCDISFLIKQEKRWLVAYILILDVTFVKFNGGFPVLTGAI